MFCTMPKCGIRLQDHEVDICTVCTNELLAQERSRKRKYKGDGHVKKPVSTGQHKVASRGDTLSKRVILPDNLQFDAHYKWPKQRKGYAERQALLGKVQSEDA